MRGICDPLQLPQSSVQPLPDGRRMESDLAAVIPQQSAEASLARPSDRHVLFSTPIGEAVGDEDCLSSRRRSGHPKPAGPVRGRPASARRLRPSFAADPCAPGDRSGWRRVVAERRDRFAGTSDPATPDRPPGPASGAPRPPPTPGSRSDWPWRPSPASTDQSARLLDDARDDLLPGRPDRRGGPALDEAIRIQGGESGPRTRACLAMVHHRRGHRDEARRWLDRPRESRPDADPARAWDKPRELCVLRSEAEAVVLLDPAFPDDPFTP